MLTALAESCGRDIRVIAYVRPQFQYFEARYAQGVWNGDHSLPFDAFVAASSTLRSIERLPWLDYRRVFAPWRAAFGDRLTVVPLERSHMPRGLLAHFLDQLGVGDLDISHFKRRNVRRGAKALEVHRLATARLRWHGGKVHAKQVHAIRRHIPQLIRADAPFTGLSTDDAHALMARFDAGNAAFARDYGVDPAGVLFCDPIIDDRVRPSIASWHDLDDDEQAAVREFLRRKVGVDPSPHGAWRRARRRAEPRDSTLRRIRFGSPLWRARCLIDPRLPYWGARWLIERRRHLRR